MKLYTSYFAHCKSGDNRVAICQKPPEWYTGRHLPILAPNWGLICGIKSGEITPDQFRLHYFTYLETIGIHEIISHLAEGDVLLCWEKKNAFCHRHLLAEWLQRYGHTVEELD